VAEVEQLLAAYQGPLIRYAYRLVHDRQVAEDMVQEAFLRFVRRPLAYGEPRQRVAWFYRVIHNLCVDWLKRESKRADIYERIRRQTSDGETPPGVVSMDRWRYLEGLLGRLNEKQGQVMLLFFREGLSYKEIVEVTGFSMSNVGMLLHRGLKRVREIMDAEGRAVDK
jgi:RNA polymerase sigma-70 factor (ECF subfamily)